MERSREAMLAQWRELLRLRRNVLKTSDLEAIHDLRVASRRFRAAVRLSESRTQYSSWPKSTTLSPPPVDNADCDQLDTARKATGLETPSS